MVPAAAAARAVAYSPESRIKMVSAQRKKCRLRGEKNSQDCWKVKLVSYY
jgi:hypothetical protein